MFALLSVLTGAAVACAPAHAEKRVAAPGHQVAEQEVAAPAEAPYGIELLGADGRTLRTYSYKGRHYILGQVGERYTIRVTNPTARRVEAVVSVDGLDAIDGRTADFVRKRGYVVPARGELRVEGFRVSTSQVAAFRFSSVSSSYAGRKGKDRNVGVIGVAIFEEKAQAEIVADEVKPHPRPRPRPHDREEARQAPAPDHDDYGAAGAAEDAPAPGANTSTAKRAPTRSKSTASGSSAGAPARDQRCCGKPKERPGLGTEFGERRHSAVSWTRFQRANAKKPDATATLRYNDAAGLQALGIPVEPTPDAEELTTRETADPFPNSRFAEPPQ